MYAFGDALLFVAVFGVLEVFPTGLALYFFRSSRWFWIALSITALAIAVTGLLAASFGLPNGLLSCLPRFVTCLNYYYRDAA